MIHLLTYQPRRYIVIDTETTGLNIDKGDRVIQISCIEIIGGIITDNILNLYINPEFKVSDSAFKIHGISSEFLKNKPKFREIYSNLLSFIGNDILVAHNATFDKKFLVNEFKKVGVLFCPKFIDTLQIARHLFPKKRNNLKVLIKRLSINIQGNMHNAFNDAMALANCFIIFLKVHKIDMNMIYFDKFLLVNKCFRKNIKKFLGHKKKN